MNKKLQAKLSIIFILLALLSCLIFLTKNQNGVIVRHNGIKTYNSIDELLKNSSMEIEIPDYIMKNSNSETTIKSTMGQLIEIANKGFVLKITTFIDYNADPLGLYENCGIDNKYNVESNNTLIDFVRYRVGYGQYPHCTIINWKNNNTAYGLMLADKLAEDEALKILNINKADCTEYIENENSTVEDIEENTVKYTLGDKISLELPEITSSVSNTDNGSSSLFFIDDKLILMIVYNNIEMMNEVEDNQNEVIVDENIRIRYLKENPFKIESNAYNDYETIINNMGSIIKSIQYL